MAKPISLLMVFSAILLTGCGYLLQPTYPGTLKLKLIVPSPNTYTVALAQAAGHPSPDGLVNLTYAVGGGCRVLFLNKIPVNRYDPYHQLRLTISKSNLQITSLPLKHILRLPQDPSTGAHILTLH